MNNTVVKGNKLCIKFEKTFEILGKKWNGLIIDLLLSNDEMRFCEIANSIDKCSDRLLVQRLNELQGLDLVTHLDNKNYALTKKGTELGESLSLIHDWSDKWN